MGLLSLSKRLLAIALLLLIGCASTVTPRTEVEPRAVLEERFIQRTIALEQTLQDENRIQNVSFPLLQGAAEFCRSQVIKSVGMEVATGFDFEEEFQRAARELSIGASVTVTHVASEGPAAIAGLKAKDIITAVNNNPLISGANASSVFRNLLNEELSDPSSIVLSVRRENEELEFSIEPVVVCDYPVQLVLTDDLNAYADGSSVYITRRMLRFTESDKELALVVAHELAHNIMGHIDKQQQNYWLGTAFDIAARTQGWDTDGYFGEQTGKAYTQDFEAEADYVGMYILANSGMDLDGATYFWRRMAVESPANIASGHTSTNPATAERFLALESAGEEIAQKRASDVPLRPELKQ